MGQCNQCLVIMSLTHYLLWEMSDGWSQRCWKGYTPKVQLQGQHPWDQSEMYRHAKRFCPKQWVPKLDFNSGTNTPRPLWRWIHPHGIWFGLQITSALTDIHSFRPCPAFINREKTGTRSRGSNGDIWRLSDSLQLIVNLSKTLKTIKSYHGGTVAEQTAKCVYMYP